MESSRAEHHRTQARREPPRREDPTRTKTNAPQQRRALAPTCLIIYALIAIAAGLEALTGEPLVASLTTRALAHAYDAKPHPNPPEWAAGANILVTPTLPGDTLAFTGGTTIVMTSHARDDEGVLKHELKHVEQYRQRGTIGLTITYVAHGLKLLARHRGDLEAAYFHHPLELEAYREQFGGRWDEAVAALTRP